MSERRTDEAIIQALVSCGSIRAACRELHIGAATLYRRMKQPGFMEKLNAVRDSAIQEASARLSDNMTAAVQTMQEVMQEAEAPQVRLNAAQAILSYGLRYTETADILRRLERLEQEAQNSETNH